MIHFNHFFLTKSWAFPRASAAKIENRPYQLTLYWSATPVTCKFPDLLSCTGKTLYLVTVLLILSNIYIYKKNLICALVLLAIIVMTVELEDRLDYNRPFHLISCLQSLTRTHVLNSPLTMSQISKASADSLWPPAD